jgi:hypothetical protein
VIDPRYWLPHWQARRALVGYPLYTVPHRQSEATLDVALALENFDHFMSVRLERLAAFREWLARHFGVEAALDEPGLRAVEAWVKRYGSGAVEEEIIGEDITMRSAFAHYEPDWVGRFAVCNVIIDLGIFFGEFLIALRPHLRWVCNFTCLEGNVPTDLANYGRPQIGGFVVKTWHVNVFQDAFYMLSIARKQSEIFYNKFIVRDYKMTRKLPQILKMADARDDGKPFIF